MIHIFSANIFIDCKLNANMEVKDEIIRILNQNIN